MWRSRRGICARGRWGRAGEYRPFSPPSERMRAAGPGQIDPGPRSFRRGARARARARAAAALTPPPHQPVLPSPLARARAGARPIGRAHRIGPCPLSLPLPRPAVRGVLRALRGGRERGREGGGAVGGGRAGAFCARARPPSASCAPKCVPRFARRVRAHGPRGGHRASARAANRRVGRWGARWGASRARVAAGRADATPRTRTAHHNTLSSHIAHTTPPHPRPWMPTPPLSRRRRSR